MNSTPLYIIIGSILGIISGLVLSILHSQEVIRLIRLYVARFFKWLARRSTVIREWYWWKKYRPSWEIAALREVKIKSVGKGFQIEINKQER